MASDETFLQEARDRWKLAENADKNQRERELADLRFYAGEQWDDDLLNARKGTTLGSGTNTQVVPARPSLTINKTLEPVRQILNQQRQADLGYELVPADDFGEITGAVDHSEIELREGMVRRIQRAPEAEDARMWSFQRAAIAGRGFRVVLSRYMPGSADQEPYIDRIYNQNSVRIDPSHEQPDASDIEWGFYGTDMLQTAFKREYPKAKAALIDNDDQWRGLGDEAPGWFNIDDNGNRVLRVTNYYYTEHKPVTLYHLSNGAAVPEAKLATLPEGVTVVTDDDGKPVTHVETKRSVKWCKITGNEKLDETDWPGKWIPIIQEVGEELQPYDGERRKQGVVRPMRDSCKGNNYVISKFVERVGLTPIPPWMMAGGQDEGYDDEYNAANTRTLSRLHYNQKDNFDQPAPPPFKPDNRADVADIAMGVQMFGQAIQATSVVPETALGNTDATVKSGKLARALIEQGEMGTSNFMDNHKRSLRHEARIINDLLYPLCGRDGRRLKIVNGQGDTQSIILGVPFTLEGQGRNKKPVPVQGWREGMEIPANAKLYKLTPDAEFNIAVKITKNIETRRQQIVQFLAEMISADPQQIQVIGDVLWKYLDVPDHAAIEERYKLILLPAIQQMLSGNSPLPPEAQQKIAMLEAQLQELMPLADKNKTDLMKAQGQAMAESERTAAEIASKERIERWKLETQLEIEMAKLGNASMMKRAEIDADLLHQHNEQQMAQQAQAEQVAADAALAEQANAHAQGQQAQAHQQALEQGEQQIGGQLVQGEQSQQHALEQGQQSHEQALEQQAVAPKPAI